MITKIELTNFKSHAHTVIEPGRVTALVGPNGCGKTSMLQAAFYLSILNDEDEGFAALRDRTIISDLVKWGEQEAKIRVVGQNNFSWEFFASFSCIPDQINLRLGWKVNGGDIHKDSYITSQSAEDRGKVYQAFRKAIYLKGEAENLAEPSYSEEIPPVVAASGVGLATTLAYLILTLPERHIAIETALKEIIPTVTRVRVRPTLVKQIEKKIFSVNGAQIPYDEERGVMGHELIFDTIGAKDLPASLISEGTLLVLGLLTLLHSSPSSQLFLLDDIEAGLHPLAQRQLMQVLKDFAEKHDRQIILTSHSPYIVDALDAKDVWVMATDKEGISHIKRLSDHPDAKRALDVLTTGELWDAEGESWVIDNAPAELANA
jgi:ABC-type cobalamin/Fe3+-siderophores transport system ATPase subunit